MDLGRMESDDNVSNEVRHEGICQSLVAYDSLLFWLVLPGSSLFLGEQLK